MALFSKKTSYFILVPKKGYLRETFLRCNLVYFVFFCNEETNLRCNLKYNWYHAPNPSTHVLQRVAAC